MLIRLFNALAKIVQECLEMGFLIGLCCIVSRPILFVRDSYGFGDGSGMVLVISLVFHGVLYRINMFAF